jgi:hypothetical protein
MTVYTISQFKNGGQYGNNNMDAGSGGSRANADSICNWSHQGKKGSPLIHKAPKIKKEYGHN